MLSLFVGLFTWHFPGLLEVLQVGNNGIAVLDLFFFFFRLLCDPVVIIFYEQSINSIEL